MSSNTKEIKSSKKNCYRPEIDGLRAFAVVAVIINHFNKDILPGGYFGVDIFFVISGFVITASLYEKPSKSFMDFIVGFYSRRIKRLFPALSFFVLITSIAISLFQSNSIKSLWTGLTSLFGLSNIYLVKYKMDYFAQSTALNPFTHTWSLGVEEQFYILFPFLIWFSGISMQKKNGASNLFLTMSCLTIASLIGFFYLYPINQPAAYFLMPPRFWEISSGCLLFIGLQKRKSLEHFLEKIPPLVSLSLLILVMYLPTSIATTSTVTVVALSGMLIASLKKGTALYTIFTNPKVVYIGLISYSLYLWHWSVLSISRWTIGVHWWSVPFQIGLILSLAIASYQWIENPLRKWSWFRKRWKNFVVGLGVLISLSLNLFFLIKPLQGKLFTGNKYNQWNLKHFKPIQITHSQTLPTIYVMGDSHADHYGSVMNNLAGTKEFNVITHPRAVGLNKSIISPDEYILAPLREYKNKFKKGDIVIFAAKINKYTNEYDFTKQYQTFIKETEGIGIKYILISPTPTFSLVDKKEWTNGYTCQEEWYRPSWAISPLCFLRENKSEWFASHSGAINKIKKFLLANQKVSYLDAFSIVCPDPYCKKYDNLSLLYKDNNHLSSYGAMKIKDTIEAFVRSN